MIRGMKRLGAAISAAVLLATSFGTMPVFALNAHQTPHTRNFDFNDLTVSDPANADATFKTYFGDQSEFYQVLVDQGAEGNPGNTYRYDAVDQVFGKPAGDKAMRIWIDGENATYTGTDPMQKLILNDKATESNLTRMNIQKGQYLDFSFDVAVDGEAGEKGIAAQYAGHDGRRYNIIRILDNQQVEVLGQNTGKTITPQKWYNFRLVMRAGDNTAADDKDRNYYWFCIDNQIVKEGFFVPTHDNGNKINCFTGFNFFWFYQNAFALVKPTTPTVYTERDWYLDNIKMISSTTSTLTPSAGTTNLNLTFGAAEDDTWLNNQWIDGSGSGKTGMSTDFKRHGTMKYQAGLGGKASDDYAANVEVRNATSNNYNFWFQQWLNKDYGLAEYGSKDYHIEFDFRSANGNTNNANLQGFFSGGAHYYLKFEGTKIVLPLDGNKQVGTYVPGRWLHIGLSMYPSTNRAKVYLDGKQVYNGVLVTDASKSLQRYKFEYNIFDTSKGKSDDIAIDNLITTVGNRPNADYVQKDVTSADATRVKVDNENKVIKVKDDVTLSELQSTLQTNGAAVRVYTDSAMTQAATALSANSMIVVADGVTYRYFTVEQKASGSYTLDRFGLEMNGNTVANGGSYSVGTLNAKAELTVFDPNTELTVVAALYYAETDQILQFKMSDTLQKEGVIDPFDGTKATITAPIEIEESEGTYVKAFLWNMTEGGLTPILAPITATGATAGEIFDFVMQYPGFTNKAVTFSFDDGRPEDKKIIDELYTPYGISGTFNLNSNLQLLLNADDTQREYVKNLYKDQEVASHVKNHPHMGLTNQPADISVSTADEYTDLIEAGISELQAITGQTVSGMAWPYENPTLTATPYMSEAQKVDEYVKNSNQIAYARGGVTSGTFDVPTTFKDWKFTAYIGESGVSGLIDQFFALPESGDLKLLSIWGHAYDLNENGNRGSLTNWTNNERYNQMKRLIEQGTKKNIWFATNIDYVKYINATKLVQRTENTITNPSDQDLYIMVNYKPIIVKAKQTFTVDDMTMNQKPTVYLAGDSTCEIVPESDRPRTGWGEKLGDYLSVSVDDRAKATRSTKTFTNDIEIPSSDSPEYGMDRLQDILDSASSGDYLFIQFGHNDSMSSRPLRYTTIDEYKTNLTSYITRAKAKGVQPVLLTSIRLCVFENGAVKVQDGIEGYRNAMKEVALAQKVPLIDIGESWRAYLNEIGETAAKQLYMVSYNGTDTTHPREEGAELLAEMIAKGVKNNNAVGVLSKYVK